MSNSSHLIPLHLISRINYEDATLLCTQSLGNITAMLQLKAKPIDANSSAKLRDKGTTAYCKSGDAVLGQPLATFYENKSCWQGMSASLIKLHATVQAQTKLVG